jgi:hypothetical protein
MRQLKIAIYFLIISIFIFCNKDSHSPPPKPKQPDVYLTGYSSYGTTILGSVYWKNDVLIPLSGGQFATGIAFMNTDVYVCGNAGYLITGPGGGYATQAVYWKNGQIVNLGNPPSYARAIVISGSDIYIAGIANVDSIYSAVYWKNGTLISLANVPYSVANAIAVSGSDVYVAGNIGSNGFQAVYWKNGTQISLENAIPSQANGIAISGSDVYVAGLVTTGAGTEAAVYWKNGVRTNLNSLSTDTMITNTYASAIAVSGTNVYVTGFMNNVHELYWKNGVQSPVNNPNTSANMTNNINGIVLSDTNVYISLNISAYSRNDTIVNVGNGYATNIAVLP